MKILDSHPRFSKLTREKDIEFLRRAIELSLLACEHGNLPFGAVLVDTEGNIVLEQENNQFSENDATCHAETSLARAACKKFTPEERWNLSLYTSCEPCCMCAGAIYWSNIGRICYAMSEEDLLAATGNNEVNPTFDLACRDVLSRGQKEIVIQGPYEELKEEASAPHQKQWK